jgi:ADP-ribosylglycohydrolase
MSNQEISPTPEQRLKRARESLEGLSVGDALGEQWFFSSRKPKLFVPIEDRTLPSGLWCFTDDTQMALSIVSILRQYGEINQDWLAESFGNHFEHGRGYGLAMYEMLPQIRDGYPWQLAARSLFDGQGSFGNGSAMRVGPLGAFFADDLELVVKQSALSAEVTHKHSEAIAGAIAAAAAAAYAYQLRDSTQLPDKAMFIDLVLPFVPQSEVREGLLKAQQLASDAKIRDAVRALGNGSSVSAQDTVPFALWCAGTHLNNYEEAIWLTVSGGGDIDTNCAIVGGIVASYTGVDGIPVEWLKHREPLPDWPFTE